MFKVFPSFFQNFSDWTLRGIDWIETSAAIKLPFEALQCWPLMCICYQECIRDQVCPFYSEIINDAGLICRVLFTVPIINGYVVSFTTFQVEFRCFIEISALFFLYKTWKVFGWQRLLMYFTCTATRFFSHKTAVVIRTLYSAFSSQKTLCVWNVSV